MKSNIIVYNDRKDRQGLLAKAQLTADEITEIVSLSEFTTSLVVSINIVNRNADPSNINIWVSSSKIPEEIDVIEGTITLDSQATYYRNTIILGLNEKIFVRSSKDNTIVRVDGYDNRTL